MKASIFFLVALLHLATCNLIFQVEPRTQDCFYEDLRQGKQATVHYFVLRGGLLDIDLRIYTPNGDLLYSGLQYEQGRFAFVAATPGSYQICFNNEMARWTAKVVQFFVEIEGDAVKLDNAALKNTETERSLMQISQNLDQVKEDQKYLRVREQRHRDTADNTNFRVFMYSIAESVLLIGISLGQVYYLRKFFEVKK